MWKYAITEHVMSNADGSLRFNGYSGAGRMFLDGRNNAEMTHIPERGPIPVGRYTIGVAHLSEHTGPITMNLDPEPGTETFGRSAFRIHGNNAMNDASHGCIILPPDARRCISDSPDRELEVVS
jgi:hypothetical protein